MNNFSYYTPSSRCIVVLLGLFFLTNACTLPEVRLAEQFVQEGNWDAAVGAYREAATKKPFDQAIQDKLKEVKEHAAQEHYKKGRQLLKTYDIPGALQEFQVALGLEPEKPEHHTALVDALRVQEAQHSLQEGKKLERLGRYEEGLHLYEKAIELDPNLHEALDGITAIAKMQKSQQAIGESAEPVTLRFQNTRLKQVFEILARTANIDVLFDKDVHDDLVTIFTRDTPFHEALNLILTTNQLFAKQVAPDTILIIPDTKQKRQQYQDLKIRTFYLSTAKAKDMANLLRTILETKRVYVNEPLNTVVIRDQPAKLALAEKIILANDRRDAEVLFDVEILEVNRTKTKKIGLNFAKKAGFGIFPPGSTSFSNIATTFKFRELTSIGKDSYLFTFPGSILLDFFKQESNAKTLASPKIRVLNNEKASINIGDKQPILLSTTNVLPGQAATGAVPTTSTVTSIEFKDTGIKLSVEPTVHLNDDISLKMKIEVTRLGDKVILQSDPEISQFRFGTRTADTVLNLQDGETVVLAGLTQEEDRKTRESIPGIDDIPGLGHLLSNSSTDKITTEVILVITPHIVRSVNPLSIAKQTLWSGTAQQFATRPLFTSSSPRMASPNETTVFPQSQSEKPPQPSSPKSPMLSPSGAGVTKPVSPSSPNRLTFVPPVVRGSKNADIRVDVNGSITSPLQTVRLLITYIPTVVEFIQAQEGPFWKQNKIPASLTVSAVPPKGHVILTMGKKGQAARGSGKLATLIFRSKRSGSSPLLIKEFSLIGPNEKPIPTFIQQGRIEIP